MTISNLMEAIERIAPLRLAEEWDNVGLLMGDPADTLRGPVLLTIDLTEAVLDEAAGLGARAIVAYHPPIFGPLKRIIGGESASGNQRVVHRAARAGLAVYSPHTALDACAGGVTDWLAEGCAGPGGDIRALRPALGTSGQDFKMVTFVPNEHLDTVRSALASAGAGIIGEYELCAFNSPGNGTFRGKAGTSPAVGSPEVFEQTLEQRLEMVCSKRALPLALATLREFHPYQEPAVDVYPLAPRPERGLGAGRRVQLDHACTLRELADRLKKHLGVRAVHVGGELDASVERIGVVPGAGGSLASEAASDGCQVFVTGEIKHHEVNALRSRGVGVVLGGHTATERGYLPRFAELLRCELGGDTPVVVSANDRDPLVLV
ncbi:MAG: Nif3-like dinuclear metal center hexameric protein [Phycisphaerales bacterium]|nr:Nif3-like dinuclear metal center hexameric protein [Phycisphaerales bacterium]